MKKKIAKGVLAAMLGTIMLFTTACGGAGSEPKSTESTDSSSKGTKVGMVALNLGTHSYSDDVNTGLENAKEELGIEPMVLELSSITEVESGYNTLISQGCNLIVVPADEFKDAMMNVSAANPDVTFIYTNAIIEGNDSIISGDCRENESAFLGGALAAVTTKTNKIGVVLAMTTEAQTRYLNGFTAGVQAVNPDAEVQIAYTNSFSDVNLGLETASVMYEKGCDIVATYAGACNLGVFSAGEEAGEGTYCIGAATGQFDESPDKIIASVVKPIDVALVDILSQYFDGTLKGGDSWSLGLKENGVDLKWTDNSALLEQVPEESVNMIEDLKQKIIDGTIVVPSTEEELETFDYVYSK